PGHPCGEHRHLSTGTGDLHIRNSGWRQVPDHRHRHRRQGRANQSQITRWVSGGELPPSREVEQEEAMLIPDKENYAPGDTAEVLVQSPFSPAEGLLTVTRNGILYTENFTIEEDTTTLLIPIQEGYYPNINIQVDLAGAAPRTDDLGKEIEGAADRPAYATGSLTLNIPPLGRTLSLDISPRETALAPGEDTVIDLTLKDAQGRPVEGAELAVVVVDEAILALTNYQLADPLTTFYYTRPANLTSTYGRSSIVLVDPEKLTQAIGEVRASATQTLSGAADDGMIMEEAMPMEAPAAEMDMADESAAGGGNAATSPITIRTNFNPLAVFAPEVTTDADGTASVNVSLPDNLTRYRVMVVAVDGSGKQFGSGESSLTARLPLMVRPSASRFLNYGDQFELPVVLQNQTDEEMQVNVVAQVGNLELTGDTGVQVTVPANNRVEVRFPGTTESAGTARVQVAAVSGAWADAATVSLPVYTPATTEAFATYGVLDEGAISQPMAAPEGVIPVYGGLEISTSSTALQALTDAVLYLVSYPFDCSEQMASRILAIASLRDVLSAFEAEGLPTPEEMETSVVTDIQRLEQLQNYDGGFPYWRRGKESIPFNTVHVALALQRARTMGFDVPEQMWQSALVYLQNIEQYYPAWYSKEVKQTISAYALYVRMQMDDPDPVKTNRLLQDAGVEELPLDAIAWIWQVLTRYDGYDTQLESIRRLINNQVVETAAAANFTTGYDDDAYVLLHSDRRTDALLLDALIADTPESDLIPKIVNGLLAHREQGHWNSTQENVFVLLALETYFKTYENVEPDFVARMWLGEDYLGSSSFAGYNTDTYQLDVPMSYLADTFADGDDENIILSKDGAGRLYYRLGLRYAPVDLQLDALEYQRRRSGESPRNYGG
ncbi:MAG: alpha-2-macroglobulin family protein, partial [Anaerolineales bacterium]